MKKVMPGFTVFIATLTLVAGTAFGGQEGHGGDPEALQFVKIGRLITAELLNKKLRYAIDTAINNSYVVVSTKSPYALTETGEPDSGFSPLSFTYLTRFDESVVVNRQLWREATCQKKVAIVFEAYSALAFLKSRKIRKDVMPFYMATSKIESVCKNLMRPPKAIENLVLPDEISAQIHKLTHVLAQILSQRDDDLGKAYRLWRFDQIFKSRTMHLRVWESYPIKLGLYAEKDLATRGYYIGGECHNTAATRPFQPAGVSASVRENEHLLYCELLSKGQELSDTVLMRVAPSWRTLSNREKLEILLHEYLGIFTSADLFYRLSSQLFIE